MLSVLRVVATLHEYCAIHPNNRRSWHADQPFAMDQRHVVEYTWPGSNWRPSACEADVIATRPQVLLTHCVHVTFACICNRNLPGTPRWVPSRWMNAPLSSTHYVVGRGMYVRVMLAIPRADHAERVDHGIAVSHLSCRMGG